MPLVCILALVCSYLTYSRCKIWKNDNTIAIDLLQKYPDDRLALNNKGFILHEQGRHTEAIELFNRAIHLKPDYTRAYINLINAYFAMNDREAAARVTDSALSHVPNDVNLLNQKASFLFERQKYADAAKFYKRVTNLRKENAGAHLALAECYYLLHNYKAALRSLDEALKYDPYNYMALNSKGYVLFVEGKYQEARNYFETSLKIKPDYTTAQINLRDCERTLRDSVAGIRHSP